MKRVCAAWLVAAGLLAGHLHLTAAESARLRHLASIYFDDRGAGFSLPEGIACGANGQVVVGDTGNDRLLRFTFRDRSASPAIAIAAQGIEAPAKIQLNSKGEIFALDRRQRRIVRLGAAGGPADVLKLSGVPPPATVVTKSFAIDAADNLYVLDVFSSRVLIVNAAGAFQRSLPLPAGTGFASDLTVDAAGSLILLDSIGQRLYSAAKDAAAFAPLGGDLAPSLASLPTHVAASRGLIFVLESAGGSIVSFGRDGSFLSRPLRAGREEGALHHATEMCVNEKDEVFIADRDNSRVRVFQLLR